VFFLSGFLKKNIYWKTIMAGLEGYASDIRRERDSIRAQMERVVAQMQKLESELEAAPTGSINSAATDAKRKELSTLRQELAELRARMRRAMEAAQRQAQAMNNNNSPAAIATSPAAVQQQQQQQQSSQNNNNISKTSPPRATNFTPGIGAAASPLPYQQQQQYQNIPAPVASPQRGPPVVDYVSSDLLPKYQQQQNSNYSPTSRIQQGNYEEARAGLLRRHQSEKMQLQELFVSLQRQMDARHESELSQLADRLREEEIRLRELEQARARWEEAHRAREMCFRQNDAPPEIAHLSHQQQQQALYNNNNISNASINSARATGNYYR
jgi:hypothetical protein